MIKSSPLPNSSQADPPETFLPSCVPNLQFNYSTVMFSWFEILEFEGNGKDQLFCVRCVNLC